MKFGWALAIWVLGCGLALTWYAWANEKCGDHGEEFVGTTTQYDVLCKDQAGNVRAR